MGTRVREERRLHAGTNEEMKNEETEGWLPGMDRLRDDYIKRGV